MQDYEKSQTQKSKYICSDYIGQPHDHSKCRVGGMNKHGLYAEIEVAPDGTMSHISTPINPLRTGKMVTIGGAWEAEYLGFENYVPDPLQDPSFPFYLIFGRKLTRDLRSQSVSDISFRSVPIDRFMHWEIPRICMVGSRLTYANDFDRIRDNMPYFLSIGSVIESGTVKETKRQEDGTFSEYIRPYVIITVLRVNPWLDPNFLSVAGPKPG